MLTTSDIIHLSVQCITVFLGVSANITLIIVIMKRTPKTMRTFSIFLKNNALIDLASLIGGGLACSRVINVPHGSTVSICIGPCTLVSSNFCLFNQSLQAVLHNLSSWLLLLSFLYRVFVLKVDRPFRSAKYAIWTACMGSYAVAAAHVYLHFRAAVAVPVSISKMLNISYYAARKFPLADSTPTVIAIVPLVMTSPCCLIVIYFIRKRILMKLKNHKDRAQHRCVVKTLTYQTLLPMASVPGALYWSLDLVYQFKLEWPGRLLMMAASFTGLASPIINLVCLPPYRKALLG